MSGKRPNKDWRMHTILLGDTPRKRAWSVWGSAVHTGMFLYNLYPTKAEAESAAREFLTKGWGDYAMVRRVDLGPCRVVNVVTKDVSGRKRRK